MRHYAAAKSQTRAVAFAALVGLALAVLSQASRVVSNGGITPLDTFNIFNVEIISFWLGALGAIPLICIVIAIGVTAQKAGLLSSILNSLGAIVSVLLVVSVAEIGLAAAYPKKEFPLATGEPNRDSAVKGAMNSCIKRQHELPQNRRASDELISNYCKCYANLR